MTKKTRRTDGEAFPRQPPPNHRARIKYRLMDIACLRSSSSAVYAYASGTFSSRRIAKKIEEDVAFRFLAGGNFPQHRTICDFRNEHRAEFITLFGRIVQIAKGFGSETVRSARCAWPENSNCAGFASCGGTRPALAGRSASTGVKWRERKKKPRHRNGTGGAPARVSGSPAIEHCRKGTARSRRPWSSRAIDCPGRSSATPGASLTRSLLGAGDVRSS